MKNRYLIPVFAATILIGSCLVAVSRSFVSRSGSAGAKASISDLSWIAGAWQTAPGGRAQIDEYWMPPAGGSMLGTGRTVAGDKTVEFEFLRIEQRGSEIYYVASPEGRCPATDFKLTRLSNQEAVF